LPSITSKKKPENNSTSLRRKQIREANVDVLAQIDSSALSTTPPLSASECSPVSFVKLLPKTYRPELLFTALRQAAQVS
jgi:hypothetical protein